MIRDLSGGFLFFALAIAAAWDLFAYTAGGANATISGTVGDWLGTGRWEVCGLAFAGGMLTAHLMGWTRRGDK